MLIKHSLAFRKKIKIDTEYQHLKTYDCNITLDVRFLGQVTNSQLGCFYFVDAKSVVALGCLLNTKMFFGGKISPFPLFVPFPY